MTNTLFILGAGASAGCGAPLMGDFLKRARKIHDEQHDDDDREHFDRVFSAIETIGDSLTRAQLCINNVEHVYTIFEAAEWLDWLPGVSGYDTENLPMSMRRVIVRTLEDTIARGKADQNGFIPPWKTYSDFADYLFAARARGEAVSVVSFNYDCELDYAFAYLGKQIDYGLNEILTDALLLKPHGSINWKARKVERPDWPASYEIDAIPLRLRNPKEPIAVIADPECGSTEMRRIRLVGEPAIIPPGIDKVQQYKNMKHVWQSARLAMCRADNIVVCGYAMPETDTFVRYLFAASFFGRRKPLRLYVFDPEFSRRLRARFQVLLGSTGDEQLLGIEATFEQVVQALSAIGDEGTDRALSTLVGSR